jgi:hypothetical protein
MSFASSIAALSAVLVVLGYYALLWLRAGSYRGGSVAIQYEPPQALSPAMLRYVWKERFDDRTFWAAILSLVSKGLATLESQDGFSSLRKSEDTAQHRDLPSEERLLLTSLFKERKTVSVNIDNPATVHTIATLAQELRRDAVGRWFSENRSCVINGAVLSVLATVVAAMPRSMDQFGALVLGLAIMAPAGYYAFFVLLRFVDLTRAALHHFEFSLLPRFGFLLFFFASCSSAFVIGSVVLGVNFSWRVVAVAAALAAANVASLLWLRMPTEGGRKLLGQIEGFREYLKSVDRMPMDRPDAPDKHAGLYEKYLPYAIALEVEQQWSDSMIALTTSVHEHETAGVRPFYLGMWNGNPVEVVYKMNPNSKYGG